MNNPEKNLWIAINMLSIAIIIITDSATPDYYRVVPVMNAFTIVVLLISKRLR